MLLFEKTHKRCDKSNKESVGSSYLLEIGSMPKVGALKPLKNTTPSKKPRDHETHAKLFLHVVKKERTANGCHQFSILHEIMQ